MSNKQIKRMATNRGSGDGTVTLGKSAWERIELRQQELLMKLDAVEKAVKSQKYATPQFSDLILAQMFKFYQEEEYCDFKIKVEGRVFKVHRLVMASCSDYFQAMLSHDMLETREECTDLKGMTLRGIEPLIEYAYSGKLDLTMDIIHDVVSGANFLQMASALDLCVTFLKESMSFENAEDILKLGELFSIPLKDYFRNYLLKNFLKFVESDSFLSSDAEFLADYLSDDALVTTSESVLFHHCLRWYNHKPKERYDVAVKVFEKIRMIVDGWPLLHYAGQKEPFLSNPSCKDILRFAEHYITDASKRYINNTTFRTRVRSTRQTIVQFGGVMESHEDYDSFQEMLRLPSRPCGYSANHYFHPDLKSWFPLGIVAQSVCRLSHMKFVEVNGCGVIVGGYEFNVLDDTVSNIAIKDVKMFSPQGHFQLWNMPSLLHARARHAAVFLDGFIYVIGGKDDRQVLSSVECLDCDKETWSYVKPLPRKLYDHAAAVCDDRVYVSGGVDFSVKKHVWCYNRYTNNWRKKQDLNCARAGHGMVSHKGCLYVAGGYNSAESTSFGCYRSMRCLLSFEQYSPATNQWTKLKGMKHSLTFFEMTVFDGKIVVMGGLDQAGKLTQYMHEYEEDEDRWKVFGELPRPLMNACCGVVTVKLTNTGCMEDETDEYTTAYEQQFDEYEESAIRAMYEDDPDASARMMENFEPGDYLLDDDDDYRDDDAAAAYQAEIDAYHDDPDGRYEGYGDFYDGC